MIICHIVYILICSCIKLPLLLQTLEERAQFMESTIQNTRLLRTKVAELEELVQQEIFEQTKRRTEQHAALELDQWLNSMHYEKSRQVQRLQRKIEDCKRTLQLPSEPATFWLNEAQPSRPTYSPYPSIQPRSS